MPAPLLARLGPTDLVYPVGPPIFGPLTADTLGNVATPGDGFDAIANPVYLALGSDTGAGANLDQDLAGASFSPGEMKAGAIDPLHWEIVTTQDNIGSTIDTSNATLDAQGTIENAVPPVQGQPPVGPNGPYTPTNDPCATLTGPARDYCYKSLPPGGPPPNTAPPTTPVLTPGPPVWLPYGPGGFNPPR